MSDQVDIIIKNDELYLIGTLDFSNVRLILEKGLAQFNTRQHLIFNFSELKTSNSAGIALMIEWLRAAKSSNKTIEFRQISPSLQSIVKAAGLDEILIK